MFTRDIRLEDCILDLIDNSIDGLVRSQDINLKSLVFAAPEDRKLTEIPKSRRARVSISISSKKFQIRDNCGGIFLDDALNEVFNFGYPERTKEKKTGISLGVYGVGLKRAIFKIGNLFEISSSTDKDAFHIEMDVNEWSKMDDSLNAEPRTYPWNYRGSVVA